jgi:probable F420-dependent oxidoreductase
MPPAAAPKDRKRIRVGVKLMRAQELFGGDVRGILEIARLCEEIGVDEVLVSDHLAMSESGHAGRPGFPYGLDYPGWYEPLGLLHAVAAVTERITLSSHVIIAPLRPALLLAKQIATLDAISGGRAALGLGAGWQKEEFDAANLPFEGRFGALCEQVEACRALWSQAPARYEGRTVRFEGMHALPHPPQGASLPIFFGVPASPRNFERIARLGVGYCPTFSEPEIMAGNIAAARAAYAAAGRDPQALSVTAEVALHPPLLGDGRADWDAVYQQAASLVAAGVDTLATHLLPQCRRLDEVEPYLRGFIEAVETASLGANSLGVEPA